MFGASNPFGQGSNSSSPFGTQTQSVFGQNNNATSNNNPFAPKPFGASSPFGAQTGGSMFGGTSTGVFGQTQASSPFGAQTGGSLFGGTSTGVFGQAQASSPFGASSQGFGSSTPSFGAASAPAFGNSPSPFGGTSTFGQNGFSTPQSSPFGSTTQQSQPAFGNSTFGSSTPFGASTAPAFGSTNTPAFGSTNTSAFGSTNTSAFGASSSPAFGASSTAAFGNSGSAFGNNAFGSGGAFGASSTPAFGASSTSAFGASTTSAFGASSTPAFGFGSSPAFGQSMQSAFGGQGSQASTSTFGNQQGGSRVMPYASTIDAESGTGTPGKLQSISAMTVHKDKGHEELRWEDYQRGDKGGKLPTGQTSGSTPAQGSTPVFSSGNFNNSQSAPLFSSNPSFAQTSSGLGQNTNLSFTQPSNFSTPSTGFPNMSTSFPSINTSISPFSQTKPAGLTAHQSTQPTQPSFSFNNSGQTQAGAFAYGQVPAMANPTATQPNPVASPFGTLPAIPQISIGQGGNSPSIQYGISSLPVVDRAAPARVSPLLTSRHLLQRRVMLPARKYRPGDDSPKVPFFSDEENFNTPKADASFTPRENPRSLFIRPLKKETAAPLKDETTPLQENGKLACLRSLAYYLF
ncbi:hypothetical protein N665_2583s0005 [Sinapis alba]|nr:hypothetical protein N665_2583s0005 [Sinapis alba]